jgi:phospholipid/cholesterol/gamma-HCH transport system ATP-binding protein
VSARALLAAPAIEFEDVVKTLGGRRVLDGLSFTVERGETFCIIGGSGSGKSVTLKHIVGLLRPDRGSVRIDGVDIARSSNGALEQARKKIGYCFQGAALLNSMSLFENVALPLREHERPPEAEIRRRVMEKLALVGLADHAAKMPAELSGGMKKRAGLARALIRNPEIVLYDEPTGGLDPVNSAVINDLILDLRKKLGVTSVLVTHDMPSAFRVSNRIAFLLNGRIATCGPPEEFRASDDPVVRQFVDGLSRGPLTEGRP